MENIKDISMKAQEFLDGIMPKNVRCIMVFIDTNNDEMGVTSDLSDSDTVSLLKEAIETIDKPEVTEVFPKKDNASSN